MFGFEQNREIFFREIFPLYGMRIWQSPEVETKIADSFGGRALENFEFEYCTHMPIIGGDILSACTKWLPLRNEKIDLHARI